MSSLSPQRASYKKPGWTIRLGLVVAMLVASTSMTRAASVDRYWELSPYRVAIRMRLDTSSVWRQRLAAALPPYLLERAKAAYGPLWKTTVEPVDMQVPSGPADVLLLYSDDALAEFRGDVDKLIVLAISQSKLGFKVSAQEYDCLLETWGPVRHATTRDAASLEEMAFAAVQQAFTPLATFQVIRETPEKVELRFRGANLPRPNSNEPIIGSAQALRPILRRVDREGQPVEDGIQQVPWTYFDVDPLEGDTYTATIVSHTPRPLGVRQRGRVDQIAAVVRPGERETRLRLHARDDPQQSLAGFRVYQRDVGAEEGEYLGKTGDDGSIAIEPGKSTIQIAYVQASGQWIAKIPVVPGADGVIDAPLADDRKRLEAEAKLVGIREELIDLVARRNILATRARAKIKAKDFEAADRLVREIEQMPTATEFEQQRIRQQERLIESSDARIQARIEQMFNDTRDVLAEFLAPGLVQDLKREIASARGS